MAGQLRIWPLPSTTYLAVVSSRRPIGPRACSFWVLMPISAPKPNSSPSMKRVEALTSTAAASTSRGEAVGRGQVAGDDGLGVAGAVPGDVVDGVVERRRRPRTASLRSRNSGAEVVVGRRAHCRRRCAGRASSPTSSTPSSAAASRGRNASATDSVDEQGLGGVAHARPLRLGVDDDVERHVEIGGRVDVDVAVAVAVDDVGHGGVARGSTAISDGPPRGMRQSIEAPQPHELDRRLAAGVLDEHDARRRAGPPWPRPRGGPRRWPGSSRCAPDEPRRKAALPDLRHSAGGVARDVRPVLVDDADDAERHAHPADPQAVGPDPAVDDLADRIGQRGHLRSPAAIASTLRSVRRSRSTTVAEAPPPSAAARRRRRWPRAARRARDAAGRPRQDERLVLLRRSRPCASWTMRPCGPPPELGERRGGRVTGGGLGHVARLLADGRDG